ILAGPRESEVPDAVSSKPAARGPGPVRTGTQARPDSPAPAGDRDRSRPPAPSLGLKNLAAAEQRQDDLRRLVGDRQRLRAQLLLDLQGGESRAFLGQVGVDQ